MRLLVCIPTIDGREEFLRRALWSYQHRTPGVDLYIQVVRNEKTCGEGWQRAVEEGLQKLRPAPDYIHFGNDDIMVADDWFPPLMEAAAKRYLPGSRMEPAGYHLGEEPAEAMSPSWVPPSDRSYFYADLPENQPDRDGAPLDHSALPFCSLGQWLQIGPFIPIHFGTDKWFYHRGEQVYGTNRAVARMDSVIFNYAAQIGRSKGDWSELDFIDFDCNIAYPLYLDGSLQPTEKCPWRGTPEGLEAARAWRMSNFDGPHHWEV